MTSQELRNALWRLACPATPIYPGASITTGLERSIEMLISSYLEDGRTAQDILLNHDPEHRSARIAKAYSLTLDVNTGNSYALLPALECLQSFQGQQVSVEEGELLNAVEATLIARFESSRGGEEEEQTH